MVTRAEISEIVYRCLNELGKNLSQIGNTSNFEDVKEGHQYFGYIQPLKDAGVFHGQIIEGFTPDRWWYKPDDAITRAELCKIICRGILEENVPEIAAQLPSEVSFPSDINSAPLDLRKYIFYLLNYDVKRLGWTSTPTTKLISGDSDTGLIRPNDPVNRAELAKLIVLAFEAATQNN